VQDHCGEVLGNRAASSVGWSELQSAGEGGHP